MARTGNRKTIQASLQIIYDILDRANNNESLDGLSEVMNITEQLNLEITI